MNSRTAARPADCSSRAVPGGGDYFGKVREEMEWKTDRCVYAGCTELARSWTGHVVDAKTGKKVTAGWCRKHQNATGYRGKLLQSMKPVVHIIVSLALILSCAPGPPRTVALGDEPAIDSLPVAAVPWAAPKPIHILMFNLEPGVYHAYANDDTLPFLWGWLPDSPARHPLDPVLRELNDERVLLGRIHRVHVEQLHGSDYHGLELHAMTGVTVTTPVTITVRRTR